MATKIRTFSSPAHFDPDAIARAAKAWHAAA